MLLNRDEIKSRNLIVGSKPSGFRVASYDVHIGTIITARGEKVPTHSLEPQGIVEVISEETFEMPPNVAGYALVKTSLCEDGILALNIGIIDPLYKGQISSSLINFGKNPHPLELGDVFLRVTFHDFNSLGSIPDPPAPAGEIVRRKKEKMLKNFSEKFLDLEEVTKKAAREAFGDYKDLMFRYVPFAVIALAVLTFLLNWGTLSLVRNYLQTNERIKVEELESKWEDRQRRLLQQLERERVSWQEEKKQLIDRISSFEARIKSGK